MEQDLIISRALVDLFSHPLLSSALAFRGGTALYEDGKLVLQQRLPLPEHAHVRVIIDSDSELEAWLKLSEESLKKVWDNDADDIFNELLEK